jgi:Tfp pilus assembly PilM family ATPase
MPPERQSDAVTHEVARQVRLPVDQLQCGTWLVSPGQGDSPNLIAAAASRSMIDAFLAWLDEQHLTCSRMDVAPLAILKGCTFLAGSAPEGTIWGALDVGMNAARLYVAVDDAPVYVRCMQHSGKQMTLQIARELGVDEKTAEQYKCRYGISSAECGHHRESNSDLELAEARMSSILHGALRPVMRDMGEEIKRAFHYVMEFYPEKPVHCLYVVGGSAHLSGLCDVLSGMLGIRVCRPGVDEDRGALQRGASVPEDVIAEMTAAIGLSAGAMQI